MVCQTQGHRTNNVLSIIAFALLAALAWQSSILSVGPAMAQGKPCECQFQSPWKAIGTRTGCIASTHKTSCEIDFGGVGTDLNLVAEILGLDRTAYRKEIYDVLITYLRYINDDKKAELVEPEFLSRALRIFMRGSYLRGPLDQKSRDDIKLLDSTIGEFIKEYSKNVSQVFIGSESAFEREIRKVKFSVGKGFIVVDHSSGQLITIYMPSDQ